MQGHHCVTCQFKEFFWTPNFEISHGHLGLSAGVVGLHTDNGYIMLLYLGPLQSRLLECDSTIDLK